ncbi:MAG: Dynein heavy chain 2, axonemal [Paramarteilia canceri]
MDEFNESAPITVNISIANSMERIAKLKATINEGIRQWVEISKWTEIYKVEDLNNQNIENIQLKVIDLEKIWNSHAVWKSFYESIKTENIFKICDDTFKEKLTEIDQNNKLIVENSKNSIDWEILKENKKIFDQSNSIFNLVKIIELSNLKQRHWDYIQKLIEWKFDIMSPFFNLETLLSKNFVKFETHIIDVINLAGKENFVESILSDLKISLDGIEMEIDKTDFIIPKFSSLNSKVYMIKNIKKELSNLKKNEACMCFNQEIYELELKLQYFYKEVKILRKYQRELLDVIFLSKKMEKNNKKSSESNEMNFLFDFWKLEIIEPLKLYLNSQVFFEKFTSLNIGEKFKNNMDIAYDILKNTITEMKLDFPKLLFLEDSFLARVVRKWERREKYFAFNNKLLYPNISSFNIHKKENSDQSQNIVSYNDNCGETYTLYYPVKISEFLPTLKVLSEVIVKTNTVSIFNLYANMQKMMQKPQKIINEHSGWNIIVALSCVFNQDCQKAIKKGNNASLEKLKNKYTSIIHTFVKHLNGTKIKNVKGQNVILHSIYLRDLMERVFRDGKFINEENFEWLNSIKHRMIRDKNEVYFEQNFYSCKYSFQCLDDNDYHYMSSEYQKTLQLLNFNTNFDKIPIINGPINNSNQISVILSSILGKECFILTNLQHDSEYSIKKFILGSIFSNSSLFFGIENCKKFEKFYHISEKCYSQIKFDPFEAMKNIMQNDLLYLTKRNVEYIDENPDIHLIFGTNFNNDSFDKSFFKKLNSFYQTISKCFCDGLRIEQTQALSNNFNHLENNSRNLRSVIDESNNNKSYKHKFDSHSLTLEIENMESFLRMEHFQLKIIKVTSLVQEKLIEDTINKLHANMDNKKRQSEVNFTIYE